MNLVQARPLIAVVDVLASTAWYAELLRLRPMSTTLEETHGNVYNRLLTEDGEFVLQLHSWDDEQHPNLTSPDSAPVGHGVLLWFVVDDFDSAVARARALAPDLVLDERVNAHARNREIWLRDPDGYTVVIASLDGEQG